MHTVSQVPYCFSLQAAIRASINVWLGVCRAMSAYGPSGPEPCNTPFGAGSNIFTTCWAPLTTLHYWPTTLPCADFTSTLHNIDSSYMHQVCPILHCCLLHWGGCHAAAL